MSSVSAVASLEREQAILSHMPHVKLIARRIHHRCPPQVCLDDLVSAGTLGLIQAVDRYEPGRNAELKTLASHRICGAILDYLRELDPMPREVRRFQRDRDEAKRRLEAHLGRAPSQSELATELGLSIEKYRRLACIVQSASVVSLDSLSCRHLQPLQIASNRSAESDAGELMDRLKALVAELLSRERTIMLGLQRGLTLRAIGQNLGISESRVSQLKSRAIGRMRVAAGVDAGYSLAGRRPSRR